MLCLWYVVISSVHLAIKVDTTQSQCLVVNIDITATMMTIACQFAVLSSSLPKCSIKKKH
uniref:Uncharacterized protein n=1 Tax=Octopus bimaculoides TaxID=37653 RepID=A0A0L8GGL4_OCTBM